MATVRVPRKSANRTKSVRSLVKDAFQQTIECVICTETKELRQLPCQHTICYDCVVRVISVARGQGLQPECSFCKAKLTGKAGDYPVCRLAANLRTELEQLEKTLSTSPYKRSTTDQSQLCESGECQRHIDRYCKSCVRYFCYSCSKCSCKDHTKDLVEFDELIKASEEKYERWRAQKMTQIDSFKEKEKKLVTEFKEQVAKASNTDISSMLESVSTMKETIQAATKVVDEEMTVYEQYESDISGVSDVEFVRLVEQLSIEGKIEVCDKDKDMAAIKLRQPSRRQSSYRQSCDISKDSDVESIKLVEQIPEEGKVEVSDKDKDIVAIKRRQSSRRQSSYRQSCDITKDSDVESIKLVEQIPEEDGDKTDLVERSRKGKLVKCSRPKPPPPPPPQHNHFPSIPSSPPNRLIPARCAQPPPPLPVFGSITGRRGYAFPINTGQTCHQRPNKLQSKINTTTTTTNPTSSKKK